MILYSLMLDAFTLAVMLLYQEPELLCELYLGGPLAMSMMKVTSFTWSHSLKTAQ